MMLSINSSMIKRIIILFIVQFCLFGCRTATDPVRGCNKEIPAGKEYPVIALLPIHNISGTKAPLDEIRQIMEKCLHENGFPTIHEDVLNQFIVNHRIRYIGGLDRATARNFKAETGVHTVFQTSLELYRDAPMPKIVLFARLIRIEEEGEDIVWMDSVGLSGDESPGLLDLTLVKDPQVLVQKAAEKLIRSLANNMSGSGQRSVEGSIHNHFQPKVLYGGSLLSPDKKCRVAVAPFYNSSQRKYAGDIIALHFFNHLISYDNITVVEPGDVRNAFLQWRIIMDDGISLTNAKVLFRKLGVDYILTGNVLDYEDEQGSVGKPKVHFSAFLIEKNSMQVVWSTTSYNQGDDRVFFFGLGDVKTAHTLATQMAEQAVGTIIMPAP
ncbi:MAG: hypothetical protein C0403_18325 [Desulfobacterium sp.]|nr:hypothetical protein [Desulfobacterium sp.]